MAAVDNEHISARIAEISVREKVSGLKKTIERETKRIEEAAQVVDMQIQQLLEDMKGGDPCSANSWGEPGFRAMRQELDRLYGKVNFYSGMMMSLSLVSNHIDVHWKGF